MLHKNLFRDPLLSVEIFNCYGYFISGVVAAQKVLLYIMMKVLVATIFKGSTTSLIKKYEIFSIYIYFVAWFSWL